MLKVSLYIITFVFLLKLDAFCQIEWSAINKIGWSDFHFVNKSNKLIKAVTASNINIEYQMTDRCVIYTVKSIFYNQKSWVSDSSSRELLEHEQGHFDITEIFARKIRSFFVNTPFEKLSEVVIKKKINLVLEQLKKEQYIYDQETNHSINKVRQIKWNFRIRNKLALLEEYASTENMPCGNVEE